MINRRISMNRYFYGLILACALLSLPSANCAAAPEPDAAEEARAATGASKEAYIQECKDAGAEKRETRRLAREAKEAAEAAAKQSESESEAGNE